MAGMAITKERIARFDKIGEEEIFDRIANGETLTSICDQAGTHRRMFHFWLDKVKGRREAYEQAKRISGGAHAERAGAVIDEASQIPGLMPAHAQLAREKREHHKWLAASFDPETFAPSRNGQGSLVVNIHGLHLDALKAAQQPKRLEAEVVEEAEWEEAGEAEEDPGGGGND